MSLPSCRNKESDSGSGSRQQKRGQYGRRKQNLMLLRTKSQQQLTRVLLFRSSFHYEHRCWATGQVHDKAFAMAFFGGTGELEIQLKQVKSQLAAKGEYDPLWECSQPWNAILTDIQPTDLELTSIRNEQNKIQTELIETKRGAGDAEYKVRRDSTGHCRPS